jgi:outer membrane protein assembly factor BamB
MMTVREVVMKCNGILPLLAVLLATSGALRSDVLQYHSNASRDGAYVDPVMTREAARHVHRDRLFNAPMQGPVYAQPLYVENGPSSKPMLLAVTEHNAVVAMNADTGTQLWTRALGPPVPLSQLPCGNIDTVGITSTPVIDLRSRTIYVAGMTTPDQGRTKQHLIFALSLDDGSIRPGWPVNASGMKYHDFSFNPSVQNQRGALLLNSGILYVPYGGHWGDCGDYHGWVIAIPVDNPKASVAWATEARGGGVWAPGGPATDGESIFLVTDTFGVDTWMGGEAVIRLSAGAKFNDSMGDYFSPTNWRELDEDDLDLGGSGPVLFDLPGAVPSKLLLALGKNGFAYLLNQRDLGGISAGTGTRGEGIQSKKVAAGKIINAAAAYQTTSATYVAFEAQGNGIGCERGTGNLVALRIAASAPPTMTVAWCANNFGGGSPIVTTTNGKAEAIVWTVGAGASNRLHAFDGDTGEILFAGGGRDEQMSRVQSFQTPIVIGQRIFVAANDRIYAFTTR